MNSKLAAFLLAGSFAVSAVVSCDSGGGGGGSGGANEGGSNEGGSSTGGKGGTSTGGKGGTSTGGKGGTASGGSSSGGAGGTAKGGSGQGGTAQGGTAQGGTAQGGSAQGGAAQGGSAQGGASAILAGDFFFKGEDSTISKLIAADAAPGYLYLTDNAGAAATLDYPAVTDAKLPAGTDTALHFNLPTTSFANIILGFNFRPDLNMSWQWADISKYKGIQFWARAKATAAMNIYLYDWNMFPMTPTAPSTLVGKCPGSDMSTCEQIVGTLKVIRTTWEQFTIPFTEFTSLNPVKGLDLTGVGRVDFLYSAPNAAGLELWVTGIKMLTEVPL